jgi:hypothetical protein
VSSSAARQSYPCASIIGEKKNGSRRECQTKISRAANAAANTASHHQSRGGVGFRTVFAEGAGDWFIRLFFLDMVFVVDCSYWPTFPICPPLVGRIVTWADLARLEVLPRHVWAVVTV